MQYGYRVREKDTAAYKIFHHRFLTRARYLDSLDDMDIEMHGVPFLNDPEFDNAVYSQEITTYRTINEMVELHRRGVNVKVVKAEDTKKIYEIINDHLLVMTNFAKNAIHVPANFPYQDLQDLDKLAAAIYPHADKYKQSQVTQDTFIRELSGISLFPVTRFGPKKEEEKRVTRYGFQRGEYRSYMDTIDEVRVHHNSSYEMKRGF